MLNLFKKNPDSGKELPLSGHPESVKLAERYEAEEFVILAVTGPNGITGAKLRKQELWSAGADLTAWRREGGAVHEEKAYLEAMADDDLLKQLRKLVSADSIIRVRVRQSGDGKRFLMAGFPAAAPDAELQATLDEAKKPVTFFEEGLGTFTLDRSVNWFEAEADWLGTRIRLHINQDENRADCILNAKGLLDNRKEWDGKIREFAAAELLELARDWAEGADGDREDPEELSKEQFMSRMEPESIEIFEDGTFDFWFGDGDMFFGHSIRVAGSLEEGPTDAAMEG